MSFIDQIERRCGWLAFPGFLRFYAILHALVFVLKVFNPNLGTLLEFDRAAILSGQVWRVVTFLFSSSAFTGTGFLEILFFFFMVMIAFMMSDALEGAWGVFKTSLFYYCGIVGLIVANFIFPNVMPGSGFLIYVSSFFAFATLFPKIEFLIFFILPVQVRFLAWIGAALQVLPAVAGLLLGEFSLLPFLILGYANYLIFAGIPALRGQAQVVQSVKRRKKHQETVQPEGQAFHVCEVCKKTEITNPRLEFRVGVDGNEYCEEHLPES